MKKTIALALLSSIPLAADDPYADNYCCPPDPCEDPCCEHLFVERSQLFITGELLYWVVEEGALDYAVKMDKPSNLAHTFAIGDYKAADYEYRPGYRVSLAWYNCPKYWEVTGQYTWLFDSGSKSTTAPEEVNQFLNPTWETITEAPFRRARSLIDMHFHLGDLYVARVFDPNPHLRMRLLGGLTMAFFDQSWKIRFSDFGPDSDKIKNEWCFWGGGIRLGLTIDWFWGGQFYLTGRTTFATLLGRYENKNTQIFTTTNSLIGDAKYKDTRFSLHNQFLLGPSWQIPCDCWSFELFAGYEFNMWFNLQETFRTTLSNVDEAKVTNITNSLMGMHGLTLRLTLGF